MSTPTRQGPVALVPTPRGAPARPDPHTLDVLISLRSHTPRDAMGNPLSAAGRYLVTQAAGALYGTDQRTAPVQDQHRRWGWPDRGVHASVAHCGGLGVVALSGGPRVGVDLQDERVRPLAMAWLGELLGFPEGVPASLRDFAESEALIKVSHLTKETFAGVRLPLWRAGWRRAACGYQLLSTRLGDGSHLALACEDTPTVRWWTSRDGARPRRVLDPGLLGTGQEA